ncbi:MAG: Peptidase [Candidatus Peribacteria bacterium]|nr:Peptidase [Candidatus Peribacteria bacterium]
MILPEFEGYPRAHINLNNEASLWRKEHSNHAYAIINPLLDPQICQAMIDNVHKKYKVLWSIGGWMEDREVILDKSYLTQEEKFIHLGVDAFVPKGTKVAIDRKARVVRIDHDLDQDGGWGTRLIFEPLGKMKHHIILAHLSRNIRCKVGQIIGANEIVGEIGEPEVNGGWLAHLHAQMIIREHFNDLIRNKKIMQLDGYCKPEEKELAKRLFPNPMKYLNFTTLAPENKHWRHEYP